ncbi:MAG TPA: hypothetical protein VM243_18170 [Phycisphaerae bacterium]|nr:hypothetical protein [Phycisphaerae bacterium]
MEPIQPVDASVSGIHQTPASNNARPSSKAGAVSAGATNTATSVATISSTSATSIYSQVDTMLAAVGGGVQDNQLLRMIIGLLILQVLMGVDGGNQQAGGAAMLDSLGLAGGNRDAGVAGLRSATNIVQIEQQSATLLTSQAVLAPTATDGDPDNPGSQVDLEA